MKDNHCASRCYFCGQPWTDREVYEDHLIIGTRSVTCRPMPPVPRGEAARGKLQDGHRQANDASPK